MTENQEAGHPVRMSRRFIGFLEKRRRKMRFFLMFCDKKFKKMQINYCIPKKNVLK